MNMGPFAGFIIASYAATALVVVGLIAWVTVDGRRQGRALAALEARGVKRRSA